MCILVHRRHHRRRGTTTLRLRRRRRTELVTERVWRGSIEVERSDGDYSEPATNYDISKASRAWKAIWASEALVAPPNMNAARTC